MTIKINDKIFLEANGFKEINGEFLNEWRNITLSEDRGKWSGHLLSKGHVFMSSGYATARNAFKALMRIYTTKLQESVKNSSLTSNSTRGGRWSARCGEWVKKEQKQKGK